MSAGKKAVGCPAESAVEVIRGRWKLMILHELCNGTVRFGELRRALTGISEKMLTQHLRELERDGIVARAAYTGTPPKVEYSLTAAGRDLKPILDALHAWGLAHGAKQHARDAAAPAAAN
jgi:DNA-binding HxlR family transcriptional regulator